MGIDYAAELDRLAEDYEVYRPKAERNALRGAAAELRARANTGVALQETIKVRDQGAADRVLEIERLRAEVAKLREGGPSLRKVEAFARHVVGAGNWSKQSRDMFAAFLRERAAVVAEAKEVE